MTEQHGKPLAVEIRDGKLVIEIGTHTLAWAAAHADWANPYDDDTHDYIRTFAITDPEGFARDVRRALQDEREDGSTLLTDLLDKASEAALDDGSEAVECEQRIPHAQFSPLETWAAEGRTPHGE